MRQKPTIGDITGEVKRELSAAMSKFPEFNSSHEGYAVIKEELDELWDAIKNNKDPVSLLRQREEAIQVAAMAIRFIHDITDCGIDWEDG